jgi:hypothetical protein
MTVDVSLKRYAIVIARTTAIASAVALANFGSARRRQRVDVGTGAMIGVTSAEGLSPHPSSRTAIYCSPKHRERCARGPPDGIPPTP